MYRTQLLLQQLGIQQWIPQQQATLVHKANVLWRDQMADEVPLAPRVDVSVVAQDLKIKPTRLSRDLPSSVAQVSAAVGELPQPAVTALPIPIIQSTTDILVEVYPATVHFTCHILVHDRFILIAQMSNEQEQRLLNNIQAACHASVFLMQWPLAIETWDMNDVVLQSYLAGVFAVHQQKICFSLGDPPFELPLCYKDTLKMHASLQQLLESAEHKQALWQALYPYVYDAETNNA